MSQDRKPPKSSRELIAPELLPALEMIPEFELTEDFLTMARQMMGRGDVFGAPSSDDLGVTRREQFVPGLNGAPDVRVLVYTPSTPARTRPAYLHIHGGGYVLGTPEMNDAPNRDFAADLDCVVVSVDYRLAPDTRFPGPIEDCYAALQWLRANAADLGVDTNRIAIGGESAGGGHAAALALYARDRGDTGICFQLLEQPMLDDRTATIADPHPFTGEFIWTAKKNRFGWQALLGVEPGGPDVPANGSPARASDLSRLPPTYIAIGALDLFLEESLDYARRLTRAGVPVELHVIPGAFHGFSVAGDGPQVRANREWSHAALRRAFKS